MRILVLGAGGQLGQELTGIETGTHEIVGFGHAECDIADPGAAQHALAQSRPDAVINCAAWTKVDAAEAERDAAFRANATGPRLLAAACRAAGVRLCHISTDYVFDGTATAPMDEAQPAAPLNVYGASKLAGEEEVRAGCSDHLVVRTSWLYGRNGPNFVLTMLRLGGERDELRVVADQRGAPTWTGHLAQALLRLVETAPSGLYHLSNRGETTWAGFAEAILSAAGLGARIVPITTAEFGAPAPRPAYSVLDDRAWRSLGEAPLPPWEAGMRAYLRERGAHGDG